VDVCGVGAYQTSRDAQLLLITGSRTTASMVACRVVCALPSPSDATTVAIVARCSAPGEMIVLYTGVSLHIQGVARRGCKHK
jgi:hypothetical protein